MKDNYLFNVRDKAVLTDTYVAGTLIENAHKYNKLALLVDFTKGSLTTAELKVQFAEELLYDLPYDGQSANFTVGKTVTGASSGAKGIIVADTDGGTSGTLVIRRVTNNIEFLDNEVIADDNTTPGTAVVNGTLSVSDYTFHQETTTYEDVANTTVVDILKERKLSATGKYYFLLNNVCRYIKISAKGTGTVTNSALGVKAVLS